MEALQHIYYDSAIAEDKFNIVYYNEKKDVATCKLPPLLTITVLNSPISPTVKCIANRNGAVSGDVEWFTDIDASYGVLDGDSFTFKKAYEGDVTFSAVTDNAMAEKTVYIKSPEITYVLDSVEAKTVACGIKTTTINYTVLPVYNYNRRHSTTGTTPQSRSIVASWSEFNSGETSISCSGISIDSDNVEVPWVVEQEPMWVDFGIRDANGKRVMFCAMNLDANNVYESGKFYQYGDTEGWSGDTECEAHSNWDTCPFNNGSTTYNDAYWKSVSGSVVTTDSYGCINLNSQYDAATLSMGENYRIPTQHELQLLMNTTTYADAITDEYSGGTFTLNSDTSKKIYVPKVYNYEENHKGTAFSARFKSSSLYQSLIDSSYYVAGVGKLVTGYKYYPLQIRPVWVTD